MEMVGEDQLPDAQTLTNYNKLIHHEIKDVGIPTRDPLYLWHVLQVVQAQCEFIPLNLKVPADREWVDAHVSQLGDMVQEAYDKKDYSALMRLSTSRE